MDPKREDLEGEEQRPITYPMVAVVGVATLVIWLLIAFRLAPELIRSAYDQDSIPFFNAFIDGQARHSVDSYLGAWQRVARLLTLALVAAIATTASLVPWQRRIYRAIRSLHHGLLRGQPSFTLSGSLLVGAVAGWLGGALEAVADWSNAGNNPSGPALELFWMAPSAAAVVGALLAAIVWLAAGGTQVSQRAIVGVLLAFVVYTALTSAGWGIHPGALAVLAIGAAVEGSRHIVRAKRLRSATTPTLAFLTMITVLLAGGMKYAESRRERQATAGEAQDDSRGVESRPNILLLILDTVRAQSLSLYGYPRLTSPNLDALASESVVFDRAVSTSSWTLPSHASMLTGLDHSSEHGADWYTPIDPGVPTVAEVLRAEGFATGAFIANQAFGHRRSGMDRGFDVYRDNPANLDEWVQSHWATRLLGRPVYQALGRARGDERKVAEHVNAELLEWLDRLEGRPFFGMVNFYDAHDPYESPEPFNTMFRDRAPRSILGNWGFETEYVQGEIDEMIDAYDSSIAYLDDRLGQLFAALGERGLLDNTLLIVTSDHGEHFGERGIALHGNSLYMPALHVPLLVRVPSGSVALRVAETVSIRDIPATVLDLIGAPATLPGGSLARLWQDVSDADAGPGGSSDSPPGRHPVAAGLSSNEFVLSSDPVARGDMRSVTTNRFHYILNGDGVEELYDLGGAGEDLDLSPDPDFDADLRRLRSFADRSRDDGS